MTVPKFLSNKKKPFWLVLLLNIAAMALVGFIILWIALSWLDSWTHHGEYISVPEVKGLSYNEAYEKLRGEGFAVEISDSVYDVARIAPGTVVEQNPKCDAKVKGGRKVYLTITAFSPKTVTIPSLVDVSVRQAKSVLEGLGFKNITIVSVPSEYRDLVLGVKASGVRLSKGARVPVTSQITLEVGAGSESAVEDSTEDSFSDYDAVSFDELDLN